jgi:hypothetical protein
VLLRTPRAPDSRSKGQYVFFDIHSWEKKMFQGGHAAAAAGGPGVDGESELAVGMDDAHVLPLGGHP